MWVALANRESELFSIRKRGEQNEATHIVRSVRAEIEHCDISSVASSNALWVNNQDAVHIKAIEFIQDK